jgi:hypothetical protein
MILRKEHYSTECHKTDHNYVSIFSIFIQLIHTNLNKYHKLLLLA